MARCGSGRATAPTGRGWTRWRCGPTTSRASRARSSTSTATAWGCPGHAFCPTETDLTKVCTKLYAKGLRNPYRFNIRPGTGPVIGDVGWEEWEELDLVTGPGKNLGWPCYEGTARTSGYRDLAGCASQYANEGTPQAATPPNLTYAHSLYPDYSAAIIGGPQYPASGGPYPSDYAGDYFYGDYVHGYIKRVDVNASGQVTGQQDFATGGPTWVDLELGPDGNIYFADYGDGNTGTGAIKKIIYTPTNGNPVARASANPTSGGVPLNVQFTGSGSTDPNNDPLTYDWDFGDGTAHSTAVNPAHPYTVGRHLHRGADRSRRPGRHLDRERPHQRRQRPAGPDDQRAG